MTTRSANIKFEKLVLKRNDRHHRSGLCMVLIQTVIAVLVPCPDDHGRMGTIKFDRAISTDKLHALQRFHTRPIDVVVYHGPDREHSFSGGFPA